MTTIGILFWGTYDLSMRKITEAFALYVITIIPITSFIFFLYDIVLIIKNVRIVNFLAVIIPLIIGILDSITGTKKLSPIGLLSIFNEEPPIAGIPNLSGYLIVELIWLFVLCLLIILSKKIPGYYLGGYLQWTYLKICRNTILIKYKRKEL